MKEWIELADGTKLENAYVVKLSAVRIAIYCVWAGTFAEAAALFCDPEKTATIKSDQYGDKATWTGYTTPTSMTIYENRQLSVNLEREVIPSV